MRRSGCVIALVLVALALFLPLRRSFAATLEDHARLVARVLDGHAVPAFAALKDATAKLPPAVSQECLAGGDTSQAAEAFKQAVIAFAAAEFYRFGPLAEKGRRERLAFWPDPRGVVARQVRQAVAAKDSNLIAPGAISQQSAALQGLPALELLLFDKGFRRDDQEAKYSCDLALAAAFNIAGVADETYQVWVAKDGMREKMLAAGPQNEMYRSHSEAAAELLKSLLTGLQAVSELQLKPRLPGAKPGAKGPFAKAGLERHVYASTTASLRKLYDLLALEASLAPEKAWMKNWAHGTWRAVAMSDGMGGAASSVPEADAPALKEVISRIGGLRMLIGKEMSNAAGIPIGFNELDGD